MFVLLSGGPPVAVAADGRRVTVEKVTFGTHHSFTLGRWWVRLLKPIRGKGWAAQRGSYETRITNDIPALMVWTRWEGLEHLKAGVAVEAAVVDEKGHESELVLNRWNAIPRTSGSNVPPAYVAWLFNNFPRRSQNIRLRIYDRDKRYLPTQAVQLAFSNPVRNRFPEWHGSELPVQVATNGTVFILNSVQKVTNALWRFSFAAQTNDKADPIWQVRGVTASSASGNIISTYSNLASAIPTLSSEFPTLNFHLRHALWPEEPAWRFTADFYHASDFQPDELLTLANVAIPPRGTRVQLATNLASHGNQSFIVKLVSVPPARPYPGLTMGDEARIHVTFDARAHVFLLAAIDDQGRQVETEFQTGAPPGIYAFGLAIPPDAQTLHLTFAIRKPTVVTFDVAERSLAWSGRR